MNRFQRFLSILFISALIIGIQADSDSDSSDDGSGSDDISESGEKHHKSKYTASSPMAYTGYSYRQPEYIPQRPPPPPPLPYYYGPHGGYYNQPTILVKHLSVKRDRDSSDDGSGSDDSSESGEKQHK